LAGLSEGMEQSSQKLFIWQEETAQKHTIACPNLHGQKHFTVNLLGTRFTNAISCFEPGPQEPHKNLFILNTVIVQQNKRTVRPFLQCFFFSKNLTGPESKLVHNIVWNEKKAKTAKPFQELFVLLYYSFTSFKSHALLKQM
jgi:hypothetical protein